MTGYKRPPSENVSSFSLSQDIAARRAARKKVIERAQRIERESYQAFMRKKRALQAGSDLATMV